MPGWLPVLGFAFAAVGVKLALALWAIYALLPRAGSCPSCGGDTVPVRQILPLRILLRVCRLDIGWCLGCGEESVMRQGPGVRSPAPAQPESRVSRPTQA